MGSSRKQDLGSHYGNVKNVSPVFAVCCWIGEMGYSNCGGCDLGSEGWNWLPQQNSSSNFGQHFDVNPKGWRLFADLLKIAAYGLEILTPAFPHLFVPIGASVGAGRSAAALIQPLDLEKTGRPICKILLSSQEARS